VTSVIMSSPSSSAQRVIICGTEQPQTEVVVVGAVPSNEFCYLSIPA